MAIRRQYPKQQWTPPGLELPQLTQVGADGRPVPLTYGPPVQHWQPPRTVNPRGEPPMTFNPNPPARTELAGGPMFAMPEYDDVPGLRQFDDALRRGGEAVGDMFFQPRPTQTPAPTPVDFMPRRPQFPMNTNFGQPQQPMPMWPPYSPTFIPQPQVSEEFARKGFEQYLYGVDPTTPPEQIINNPAAAGSGQSYYDKRALQNRGYTPQQAVAGMQAGRGAQQPMTDPQSIFQLQAWRDTAGRQPSPMPPEPPPVTAEQIRGQNPEQLRAAGMGFPMPGAPPTSAPAAQELLALRGGMRPGMGSPASDVRTAPPAMWQPDMGTVPRGAEFVKQREERLAKEKQLSDFLGARQLPYRPLGSVSETGGVPASDTAQAELARLARYSGNPQVTTPGKMSFADYKKMAQTSAPFAETQATLPAWVGQGGTRITDEKKYAESQQRRQDTEAQRALNLRANRAGTNPAMQAIQERIAQGKGGGAGGVDDMAWMLGPQEVAHSRQRQFEGAEAEKGRQFQGAETGKQRQWQTGERTGTEQFTGTQNDATRAASAFNESVKARVQMYGYGQAGLGQAVGAAGPLIAAITDPKKRAEVSALLLDAIVPHPPALPEPPSSFLGAGQQPAWQPPQVKQTPQAAPQQAASQQISVPPLVKVRGHGSNPDEIVPPDAMDHIMYSYTGDPAQLALAMKAKGYTQKMINDRYDRMTGVQGTSLSAAQYRRARDNVRAVRGYLPQ